jgi:hemin uptake protein HemP
VETSRGALPPQPRVGPRRVSSHALLGGARELVIEHRGEEYRLRITSNDKLILTK